MGGRAGHTSVCTDQQTPRTFAEDEVDIFQRLLVSHRGSLGALGVGERELTDFDGELFFRHGGLVIRVSTCQSGTTVPFLCMTFG